MIFHLSVETPEYSMCVNGGDLPALVKQMDDLLATIAPGAPVVLKGEVLAPVEAKAPGKPGRKPKAAEVKQTDIEEVIAEQDAELDAPVPVTLTIDDVTYALKNVNEKHGMAAVREIINDYDAQKINQLKPEHFVAVIEAAKKKAAA